MNNIHMNAIDSRLSEVVLEDVERLKKHLDEVLSSSTQTRIKNLIKETEILIGQAKKTQKTYQEIYDAFNKITESWFVLWNQYKHNSEAINLIQAINHLTDYSIAYSHLFLSLSLINEGRSGKYEEDLERITSGFLLLSQIIDVFSDYFSISELTQVNRGAKNAISVSSRNVAEYFENDLEISKLVTQLKAYSSLIILKTEEQIKKSEAEFSSTKLNNKHVRPFGLCTGEFLVPNDFDEALPEEVLSAFEG